MLTRRGDKLSGWRSIIFVWLPQPSMKTTSFGSLAAMQDMAWAQRLLVSLNATAQLYITAEQWTVLSILYRNVFSVRQIFSTLFLDMVHILLQWALPLGWMVNCTVHILRCLYWGSVATMITIIAPCSGAVFLWSYSSTANVTYDTLLVKNKQANISVIFRESIIAMDAADKPLNLTKLKLHCLLI